MSIRSALGQFQTAWTFSGNGFSFVEMRAKPYLVTSELTSRSFQAAACSYVAPEGGMNQTVTGEAGNPTEALVCENGLASIPRQRSLRVELPDCLKGHSPVRLLELAWDGAWFSERRHGLGTLRQKQRGNDCQRR